MAAYPGEALAQIFQPRFNELFVVTAGFPKTNAVSSYESMEIFMRDDEGIKWNFKTIGNKDVRKMTLGHAVEVRGAVNMYDTSIPTLLNIIKLSKNPVQVFAGNVGGDKLNFTGNASIGTPDGSRKMWMNFRFVNNQQKRHIELTFSTQLTIKEMEWIIANKSAYDIGEAAGTTLGLTEVTDTRSKYIHPGFESFLANDVNVGHFEDAEQIIESVGNPLNGGIGVNRMLKTTYTIRGRQDSLTALAGAVTHSETNWSFKAKDMNTGTQSTWTHVAGGLGVDFDHSIGDQYGGSQLTLEAEYPYDTDFDTPAYIDLSTEATPTFTNVY